MPVILGGRTMHDAEIHKSPLEIHRTERIPDLPICFEKNNYCMSMDESNGHVLVFEEASDEVLSRAVVPMHDSESNPKTTLPDKAKSSDSKGIPDFLQKTLSVNSSGTAASNKNYVGKNIADSRKSRSIVMFPVSPKSSGAAAAILAQSGISNIQKTLLEKTTSEGNPTALLQSTQSIDSIADSSRMEGDDSTLMGGHNGTSKASDTASKGALIMERDLARRRESFGSPSSNSIGQGPSGLSGRSPSQLSSMAEPLSVTNAQSSGIQKMLMPQASRPDIHPNNRVIGGSSDQAVFEKAYLSKNMQQPSPTEGSERAKRRTDGPQARADRKNRNSKSGRIGVIFAGDNSIAAGILNVLCGLFAFLKKHKHEIGGEKQNIAMAFNDKTSGFLQYNDHQRPSLEKSDKNDDAKHSVFSVKTIKNLDDDVQIYGYMNGPDGFLKGKYRKITKWTQVKTWLNQGGCAPFSYSSSPPNLQDEDVLEKVLTVIDSHRLKSLIIIGGPRDLSWAQYLNFQMERLSRNVSIIGVPKSKNANFYFPLYLPITLGFDSSRRMLSELAGNVATDVASSKKYSKFLNNRDDVQLIYNRIF